MEKNFKHQLRQQFLQLGAGDIVTTTPVPGGCINSAYRVKTKETNFFVKTNSNCSTNMFSAEKFALDLFAQQTFIRVPKAFAVGKVGSGGFIVLEWIDLIKGNELAAKKLGTGLGQLHRVCTDSDFGFELENTIGSTPQKNLRHKNWLEFLKNSRFEPIFNLVITKYQDHELLRSKENFLSAIDRFFMGVDFYPSLLHGDLWSGNWAMGVNEEPVIFDPASFYGHSEVELSIMKMFGGFSKNFYHSYHEIMPKLPGMEERIKIYQLYHYLNHYYIFGAYYRAACMDIIRAYI